MIFLLFFSVSTLFSFEVDFCVDYSNETKVLNAISCLALIEKLSELRNYTYNSKSKSCFLYKQK